MNNIGIKVLSLFDGMSCGMVALKNMGVDVDRYIAYEIDKYAIQVSTHNFPQIEQRGDVFAADFSEYEGFDAVIGGSPCFAAGTMIYTSEGFKPIEIIAVGDLVLTHKNRFKKVTAIGNKQADTFKLEAMGILPTIVTSNHPYYIRNKIKIYNPKTRGMIKHLESPMWINVGNLTPKRHQIGINSLQTSENPLNLSMEDCWLLGRYVADGHNRIYKRKHRKNSHQYQLIISVGDGKLDAFKDKIKSRHFVCFKHSQSVHRCVFCSQELCEFVRKYNFGEHAKEKNIPSIIMNLPVPYLKEFLEGYFSGDGCKISNGMTCTTVSRKLALTLPLAILKAYGVNTSVSEKHPAPTKMLLGRLINQSKQYIMSFHYEQADSTVGTFIDNQMWLPVKRVEPYKNCTVYNLSVEEDESYTANNAIVHNCTFWSIAQKNNRETEASGMGWELFSQYVRAIKEVKPRFFLYENNKSMSKEIRASIDNAFGFEAIGINSALVSAQNRQRLYWVGIRNEDGTYRKVDIQQPEDRGILLRDILESGVVAKEKAYCLKHQAGNIRDHFKKHHTDIAYEPVGVGYRNRREDDGKLYRRFETHNEPKANAMTTVQTDSMVAEPINTENNLRNLEHDNNLCACPALSDREVDYMFRKEGRTDYGYIQNTNRDKAQCITANIHKGVPYNVLFEETDNGLILHKSDGSKVQIYEVRNGMITIKDKQYPIKLIDGYYIIRKLTVLECMRLQTVPEWYDMSVISNSQSYRCLGNGWTCEVIMHLLQAAMAQI